MVRLKTITIDELRKEEAKEVRILLDSARCGFGCPSDIGLQEEHSLCSFNGGEAECLTCWAVSLNKALGGGNINAYREVLKSLQDGKITQLLIDKEGHRIKVQSTSRKIHTENFYTFEVNDIGQEILSIVNKIVN